ncbi:unnamed protein product, partial [marine sediment metagenome]
MGVVTVIPVKQLSVRLDSFLAFQLWQWPKGKASRCERDNSEFDSPLS